MSLREKIDGMTRNPWFKFISFIFGGLSGIGVIITIIVYRVEISNFIKVSFIANLRIFSIQISLWIFFIAIIIFFVIFFFVRKIMIKNIITPEWLKYKMDKFNTSLPKSTIDIPVSLKPLEMKEYQIDLGDNVLFVWDYIKFSENEYKINEEKLKPICDKCMCEFIYSERFKRLSCPVCEKKIILTDEQKDKVRALIERKIKTGKYRKSKYFAGKKKCKELR